MSLNFIIRPKKPMIFLSDFKIPSQFIYLKKMGFDPKNNNLLFQNLNFFFILSLKIERDYNLITYWIS